MIGSTQPVHDPAHVPRAPGVPWLASALERGERLRASARAERLRRSAASPLDPKGRLVELPDGRRLHLLEMGREHDGPTVVLEAGHMSTSLQWAWVQPRLAGVARVVSYDRAGLGWSDPGPRPRDAEAIVKDLHAALHVAGVPGPYLLVGHSFGALYARVFTGLHPDEVAGLVLVDPSHPDQFLHITGDPASGPTHPLLTLAPLAARLGVLRRLDFVERLAAGLPEAELQALKALLPTPKHVRAALDEGLAFPRTRMQVHEAGPLGDRPLLVLTAERGRPERFDGPWLRMQEETARLSSLGAWRIVPESTHTSLATNRRHAHEVADGVRELLLRLR